MTRVSPGASLSKSEQADVRECTDDLSSDLNPNVSELYRSQSYQLERQLARKTGCAELARDLAQEAFTKLWGRTHGDLSSIEKPENYLRRIATNLVRNWARNNQTAQNALAALEVRSPQFVDQIAMLESRDTLRLLEQVVSKMRPRTREIFLAHRVEGLSYAEIGARFSLGVRGVEWHMSKAIAKIDRALDRD